MIEIDIRDLVPDELMAKFAPEVQQVLLHDIADAARAHWIRLAHESLQSSEQEYVKGISSVHSAQGMAWVTLEGQWPNMIEQGFASFDLRDTLLQSGARGVHESASGDRYRSLFFRRGTGATKGAAEGARGRNFPKVGDLYARELGAKRARAIGRGAMKAVKGMAPTTSHPGGATRWGERLPPGAGGAPRLRKGELSPHGHPLTADHKSDLMAGAYHFTKDYGGGRTQSYTGVFRTISTAEPDGWIHPGYKPGIGANLSGQVGEYMARVAPQMMSHLGSELP